MKSSLEPIPFTEALRDVTLVARRADAVETPPAPPVDWDARIRAAREEGRAEGERALSEQLVKQRAEMKEVLESAAVALREAVPQIVRDTEQHLVALTLQIAQKLVSDMPVSVEMVEAVVRDALSQVEGTAECHIRLHPADLELLRTMNSSLLASETGEQGAATLRFHGSPEVTRGGCLVQTRFGIVDARRETKFDLLQRSLLG
jgi:flagellar assembly protein FliH